MSANNRTLSCTMVHCI